MPFELPKLPYAADALEPVISRQTIDYHYGKHHQAYITNLNNLIAGTGFENATLDEIVKGADGPIFNNGAQVWNHTFYFSSFTPKGTGKPTGSLASAIDQTFGSFDAFKDQFSRSAVTLFGSGWAWLSKNADGSLVITQEVNAGNPLKKGLAPLLTFDVWEHAYYLDYQNKRPDYVQALWGILDWEVIGKRF